MVIDIFSIVFDIRKANSMKNGQFWPNFRAGEADSWFKLKKTFKMAWRPYFSYPHDEICHVNYKYAKNSRHHKKTVKKLDVCDLSEFRGFHFSSLEIKILSMKYNLLDLFSIALLISRNPKKHYLKILTLLETRANFLFWKVKLRSYCKNRRFP